MLANQATMNDFYFVTYFCNKTKVLKYLFTNRSARCIRARNDAAHVIIFFRNY